jgi:hypothetical protein
LAIESSELNGAVSPANCARKMAGPLIVFNACLLAKAARRRVGSRRESGADDAAEGVARQQVVLSNEV